MSSGAYLHCDESFLLFNYLPIMQVVFDQSSVMVTEDRLHPHLCSSNMSQLYLSNLMMMIYVCD